MVRRDRTGTDPIGDARDGTRRRRAVASRRVLFLPNVSLGSIAAGCCDFPIIGRDLPGMPTTSVDHSLRNHFSSAGTAGFDYLDPGAASHMLIPPANSTYLDKLKAPQQQMLQQQMIQQQQQQQQLVGGNGLGSNQPGGLDKQQGNSSLLQAMAAMDQGKPMRFTAAMMANAQSSGGGAAMAESSLQRNVSSSASAGNNEMTSPILTSMNSHELTQELLRQQLLLQQNKAGGNQRGGNANFGGGVMVVEPSSKANTPDPVATMIGLNGDGLLYPLKQQQQLGSVPGNVTAGGGDNSSNNNNNIIMDQAKARSDFLLAAAAGNLAAGATPLGGGILNFPPTGGRASAPPPQSQPATFVPGGMTTLVMNNAAIRAYAASSLQMRVAELHQEIGGGTTAVPPPPGVVIAPRPAPPGGVPVPPPPPGILRPPSRGGGAPAGGAVDAMDDAARDPGRAERRGRERESARELAPFLRERPPGAPSDGTRGLAVLHASSLRVPDVRSTCEAFGALESFRPDFGESRGVYFATFYDLRSAELAVGELPKVLNKLVGSSDIDGDDGFGDDDDDGGRVQVRYCVPLNSSSATDESMIMLSNLPGTVDEQDLNHVLSSFGEVRAIHYQANMSEEEDEDDLASYLVEFYDVQDARQALLELEQTNPWGGDRSKVKVGTRSPKKRKQGKDLIMLMSCWRQGGASRSNAAAQKGGDKSGNGRQSSSSPPQQQQQQRQHNNDSVTASPTPSPSPVQQVQLQLQQQDTFSSQTARTSHVGHEQNLAHQQQQQQQQINQNNSMGSTAAPVAAQQPYYQQQYQHHHQGGPGPVAAPLQQYQLVVGPDGQYSYALVNVNVSHPPPLPQMVGHPHYAHMQQHVMYATAADQQQHYQMHGMQQQQQHHVLGMNPALAAQQQQYHIQYNGGGVGASYIFPAATGQVVDLGGGQMAPPTPFVRLPSGDVNSSSLSSGSQSPGHRGGGGRGPDPSSPARAGSNAATARGSAGSIGSGSSGGAGGAAASNERANNNDDLLLDVSRIRSGRDRRSSLMVRNIPNKYTQQMLLSEFALAGHGPTKMDFFYLPIDFKNRCNRGYAFVNFVDYRDVLPFVEEYNGRGWRRFNSDKVCDVTYARIQGKAAMLKRFENSALMEKDDEYRPKVFVSHGERKGQVESM